MSTAFIIAVVVPAILSALLVAALWRRSAHRRPGGIGHARRCRGAGDAGLQPLPDYVDRGGDSVAQLGAQLGAHVVMIGGAAYTDGDPRAVQAFLDGYDPLPFLKAQKKASVDHERDRRFALAFIVMLTGGRAVRLRFRHDADLNAILRLAAAAQAGAAADREPLFEFRDAAGTRWMLSAGDLAELALAGRRHVALLAAAARAHKSAVDALSTAPAVDAYDCSRGWPGNGPAAGGGPVPQRARLAGEAAADVDDQELGIGDGWA